MLHHRVRLNLLHRHVFFSSVVVVDLEMSDQLMPLVKHCYIVLAYLGLVLGLPYARVAY